MLNATQDGNSLVPVTSDTVQYFLATALRNDRFFHLCRSTLTPQQFNRDGELAHSIIWDAALEYFTRTKAAPKFQSLASLALGRARASNAVEVETLTHIETLLRSMFSISSDELDIILATDYFKAFVYDRTVGDAFDRASEVRRRGGTVNYPSLVHDFELASRNIDKLQHNTNFTAVPDFWDRSDEPVVPTGIHFVDEMMNGGAQIHDVNVLLGATGVGKTLLIHQMAVAYAKEQARIAEVGGTPKLGAIVSYEDDLVSMQIRAMSCAALIDARNLLKMRFYTDLSTSDNLLPYELKLYENIDMAELRLGEQERRLAVKDDLNKYLALIDFSGTGKYTCGGTGGPSEIRAMLQGAQEHYRMDFGYIWIDWAGMAVRRYMRSSKQGWDKMTAELIEYVDTIKSVVSGPLNCPVMVAHQLSGQANKTPPTKLPNHTDAEWCTSFAVNAPYALIIGTKDIASSACLVGVTKLRRGGNGTARICRIDGHFGQLVPAANELKLDLHTKRIVAKRELDHIRDDVSSRSSEGCDIDFVDNDIMRNVGMDTLE